MIKIVLLILMLVTKDGEHNISTLALPAGTTVQECIDNHQPAEDAKSDGVIKFGFKCVEVDVLPTSDA